MFLKNLNNEEKNYFWSLVNIISTSDNECTDEEKAMLDEYRNEMRYDSLTLVTNDIDKIIDYFANTSLSIRNSVYLESIALILADENYDKAEEVIADKMTREFDFDEDKKAKFFRWVKDMQILYKRATELVND